MSVGLLWTIGVLAGILMILTSGRTQKYPEPNSARSAIDEAHSIPKTYPLWLLRKPGEPVVDWLREAGKLYLPTIALVVASFPAYYAYRQLTIAEARIRSDQRPWVSLHTFSMDDTFLHDEGAILKINFTVKNSGLSPALHITSGLSVLVDPEPYFARHKDSREAMLAMQRDEQVLTRNACSSAADFGLAQNALFPRDELSSFTFYHLSLEEVARYRAAVKEKGEFTEMFTVLCVAYRSPLDETIHRTSYRLSINLENEIPEEHDNVSIKTGVGLHHSLGGIAD